MKLDLAEYFLVEITASSDWNHFWNRLWMSKFVKSFIYEWHNLWNHTSQSRYSFGIDSQELKFFSLKLLVKSHIVKSLITRLIFSEFCVEIMLNNLWNHMTLTHKIPRRITSAIFHEISSKITHEIIWNHYCWSLL